MTRNTTAVTDTLTLDIVAPEFQRDFRNEGFRLVRDAALEIGNKVAFELVRLHDKDEKPVRADIIISRAEELTGVSGQHHAEFLLTNPTRIPEAWRKYVLVFPGTLWADRFYNHLVPYLNFGNNSWGMGLMMIGGRLVGDWRFVRNRVQLMVICNAERA